MKNEGLTLFSIQTLLLSLQRPLPADKLYDLYVQEQQQINLLDIQSNQSSLSPSSSTASLAESESDAEMDIVAILPTDEFTAVDFNAIVMERWKGREGEEVTAASDAYGDPVCIGVSCCKIRC